jgi:hypothetical protein
VPELTVPLGTGVRVVADVRDASGVIEPLRTVPVGCVVSVVCGDRVP